MKNQIVAGSAFLFLLPSLTTADGLVGEEADHIYSSRTSSTQCAANYPLLCQTRFQNYDYIIRGNHTSHHFIRRVDKWYSTYPVQGEWRCSYDEFGQVVSTICPDTTINNTIVYSHNDDTVVDIFGDLGSSSGGDSSHPGKTSAAGSGSGADSPAKATLAALGTATRVLGPAAALLLSRVAINGLRTPHGAVIGAIVLSAAMYDGGAKSANTLTCSKVTDRRKLAPTIDEEFFNVSDRLSGSSYGSIAIAKGFDEAGNGMQQLACDPPDPNYKDMGDYLAFDFVDLYLPHLQENIDELPQELREIFLDVLLDTIKATQASRNALLSNEKYSGALAADDTEWVDLHRDIFEIKNDEMFVAINTLADNIQLLANYLHTSNLDFEYDPYFLLDVKNEIQSEGLSEEQKAYISALKMGEAQFLSILPNLPVESLDLEFTGNTAAEFLIFFAQVLRGETRVDNESIYEFLYPALPQTKTTECDVDSPQLKRTLKNGVWSLLSLPCHVPEGYGVIDIFSDDIPGEVNDSWAIFTFDSDTNDYVQATADTRLEPGQGFWIIHISGEDRTIDLPVGSTATQSSVVTSQCRSVDGCETQLLANSLSPTRWDLIGNPRPHSASFDDITIATANGPCSDYDGCSVSDAADADQGYVLHDTFFKYNDSLNPATYSPVSSGSSLSKWDGYWVARLDGAEGTSPTVYFPR